MQRLPIDDVLPALGDALGGHGATVLVAPPGAGKTTRVPGAILDRGLAGGGDVVVLEPRRLAARLAATRVASERGSALGGEVGYEVRFDRRAERATRIRFVTEGILTRRLLDDAELRGTGCVVIDEFHERHLAGDLALAMVRRLQLGARPDLKLVVMSATMDPLPVRRFLGDAPVVVSEGRMFEVAIEHAAAADARPLGKQVASAVRRLVDDGLAGDVLVFLPGAAEIRRTGDDLAELAARHDLMVAPLYGDLPSEEQDRAIARGPRRKIILSTNVAETSVTIDGVVAVIDSGVARVARHSPWSGLPILQIEPISRASATQRAGRAGRTAPGRCLRLYTAHDFGSRRDHDAAEVARADLSEAALELHAAGVKRLDEFAWFETPPPAALAAAEELLRRLGAVDEGGALSAIGQRMLRFPAHPRQARLLVEAERRGVAEEGALLAAVLGARELRLERRGGRGRRASSDSDLLDDLDLLLDARDGRMRNDELRHLGLDVATAHGVDRAARQLERLVDRRARSPGDPDAVDDALKLSILTGYPDRVARRRTARGRDLTFAGGGGGELAESSSVLDAEWMVAVDAAETGERGKAGKVAIRRASAIDPSWLLDLGGIEEVDELAWSKQRERVERRTQLRYGELVIDEETSVDQARQDPRAAAILAQQAVAAGLGRFVELDALAAWRARLVFAARLVPGLVAPTDEHLAAILADACQGLVSFAELGKADLLALIEAQVAAHRAAIDRVAPTHLALPRRKRVAIHYELDRPPWLASRMQDFFGLAKAPAVGDGSVALVLHLLAPNQRPVQVTQDLPGFWVRHYPAIRKELSRKYPRHDWPEDPSRLVE